MVASPIPTIFFGYAELRAAAAELINQRFSDTLLQKKSFVLGCATGSTPEGVYTDLVKILQTQPLDETRLSTVNLDEYYPIQRTNPHSYHNWMLRTLWKPLATIDARFDYHDQAIIPMGEAPDPQREAKRYEQKIRAWGGVDLQILGIGENGHIAFNEPGSAKDSRTRLVTLTDSTRQANAKFFGGDVSAVPKQAITMGIATILEAKEILVMVSGKQKADIMKKIFSSQEPTPDIPATFLMTHPRVQWYLDAAAASRLP